MDGITKQTRRQSYDGIRTRSGERCKLILETLGNRSMTVEEITGEVYETAGQPTDDHQTTGGRNNMKVVKIAPAKEA